MKRVVFLILISVSFISFVYAQRSNSTGVTITPQEEYDSLVKQLTDKGVEPEEAKRMTDSFIANRDKLRSERESAKVVIDKAIALTEPNDIAFKAAMDKDLSFGEGERTQLGAINAWEEILKRSDISEEQRLFTTWRIASLYAYNFDNRRGESPNFEKSVKMFKEALNMIPELICMESINSATQYASHIGTDLERVDSLVESYRFLKTSTPEMINKSAEHINKNGYALDKKFFSNIARLTDPPIEEKIKLLDFLVQKGIESLNRYISNFLKNCKDEIAAKRLLKLLEEFANTQDLENWRNIQSQYESTLPVNKSAMETLEAIKDRTILPISGRDANISESTSPSSQIKEADPVRVVTNDVSANVTNPTDRNKYVIYSALLLVIVAISFPIYLRYFSHQKTR
jgi:hypothetical protein